MNQPEWQTFKESRFVSAETPNMKGLIRRSLRLVRDRQTDRTVGGVR
jgi:hypothetical protein